MTEHPFPAMTVFYNKLYIIRKTDSNEPQLWKYNGMAFSLVCDNGSGYSNMGNSNNKYITMAIVNGDRLYIGFDNINGVQIFRTHN